MPIYANFYYVPKDAAFTPGGEGILAVVDRLLEDHLVQFDVPAAPAGRERNKGIFARMREAVLGQIEAAKQQKEGGPEPVKGACIEWDTPQVGEETIAEDDPEREKKLWDARRIGGERYSYSPPKSFVDPLGEASGQD